jgi:hypothetical protein
MLKSMALSFPDHITTDTPPTITYFLLLTFCYLPFITYLLLPK